MCVAPLSTLTKGAPHTRKRRCHLLSHPSPLFAHVCGPPPPLFTHVYGTRVFVPPLTPPPPVMDQRMYDTFVTSALTQPPTPTSSEHHLLTTTLPPLLALPYKPVPPPPNFRDGSRVLYATHTASNTPSTGLATAVLDCAATAAMSWLWTYMSNDRVASHLESGTWFRKEICVTTRSKLVGCVKPTGVSGVDDRIFPAWMCWGTEGEVMEDTQQPPTDPPTPAPSKPFGETYYVMFTPMTNHDSCPQTREFQAAIDDNAAAKAAVVAQAYGYWKFKPMASKVCEVTTCQQNNLGGSFPKWLMDRKNVSALCVVERMVKIYERKGGDVDAEIRATFGTPPTIASLSAEQKRIFADCEMLDLTSAQTWFNLPSPSPHVHMEGRHNKHSTGRRIALGRASTVLDCDPGVAVAWFYEYCSRERMRNSEEVSEQE